MKYGFLRRKITIKLNENKTKQKKNREKCEKKYPDSQTKVAIAINNKLN